ncbi:hypothetical protein ASC97_29615 [Rhizobium sp. Root1203]|jgi:hypothetical protein|uniref:hypothetical protein n=1 Tax=Rhizobium sp. Root1203 TaxID=1736427 RepID=UPI00070FCE6D|nr:hypothetical protein [Rhizobium sp. Root1203]KQV18228.1 hypothetical protein ASC97_29615 [Rhizobium sp. Root1203]
MKNVRDWLEDQVSNDQVDFNEDSALEQHAEIIRAAAEAAGYSADELDHACGGDIAEYLRYRQKEVIDEDAEGKMAGDTFPIPVPGFNQQ